MSIMKGRMGKKRAFEAEQPVTRSCDQPGCEGHGEFRAPRSRDELNSYYWFCLDHVRAYNAQWDFYKGMSAEEIEAAVRKDTTWQRPTWPLGGLSGGRGKMQFDGIHDPFGFFDEDAAEEKRAKEQRARAQRRAASPEDHAMTVLELTPPLTIEVLKSRYKVLVKRHHPDTNGGDKAAEERFKTINEAYKLLVKSLNA